MSVTMPTNRLFPVPVDVSSTLSIPLMRGIYQVAAQVLLNHLNPTFNAPNQHRIVAWLQSQNEGILRPDRQFPANSTATIPGDVYTVARIISQRSIVESARQPFLFEEILYEVARDIMPESKVHERFPTNTVNYRNIRIYERRVDVGDLLEIGHPYGINDDWFIGEFNRINLFHNRDSPIRFSLADFDRLAGEIVNGVSGIAFPNGAIYIPYRELFERPGTIWTELELVILTIHEIHHQYQYQTLDTGETFKQLIKEAIHHRFVFPRDGNRVYDEPNRPHWYLEYETTQVERRARNILENRTGANT